MKKIFFFIIALIGILAISGCLPQQKGSTPQNTVAIIEEETVTPPTTETESNSAKIVTYSTEALATAQENGEIPLLYFYADWCPTCRALNAELDEKLDTLPENLTILKINFDTADELKKKHQITIQHTLIQLDNNGNEITRWIGGDLNTLREELVL